ncbi:MAG: hypothetical protein CM1200mP7_3710 [Chloroflexota bacterium]|nr:MAG: hypothetical protein CM1200mP7_3710 [Chloroflexota bacterium]
MIFLKQIKWKTLQKYFDKIKPDSRKCRSINEKH